MCFPDGLDGLGALLRGFTKGSRDKTENNNLQMKHMIDSFEALKKKNAKKVNKWGKMEPKMNLKWEIDESNER